MASAVNQTPQQMQYMMHKQKHSAHQPLDFSTPSPSEAPITNQSQDILDLCVRRSIAPSIENKIEHSPTLHTQTPSPVPQTFIQYPVTILQQQLMQHPPHTIVHESRLEPHTTPEYCPSKSEGTLQLVTSPPVINTGVIVAGYQQSMQFPIIKPTPLPQILNTTNSRCKPTRPFKAYPKDPLSLSIGVSAEAFLGHGSNEAYTEFRRRMLDQVQAATSIGSTSNKSRSNMKRPLSPDHPTSSDAFLLNGSPSSPEEVRNAAYWERRRKNNEAAKRSRDARRAKEDEIAIRAAFLEQENMKLKYELAALRNEAAKLRCMVYNS